MELNTCVILASSNVTNTEIIEPDVGKQTKIPTNRI